MNRPPLVFETERLILRKPRLDDAEAVFANYAQDPEVTRYLPWAPHTNVEATRGFIEEHTADWEHDKEFTWVITLTGQDTAIGMIALRMHGHKADIGYVLGRSYWGQGIMTETAKAIVDWTLAQPEIFRVWAVCDVGNAASARVLEKCGMVFEGTLKRWSRHQNASEPCDCLCYAKTK